MCRMDQPCKATDWLSIGGVVRGVAAQWASAASEAAISGVVEF